MQLDPLSRGSTEEMDWNETQAALQLNISAIDGMASPTDTGVLHNSSLVRIASSNSWYNAGRVQIPLYSIIFVLSVVGNTLVILTLVQNQRMRTVTNVFLLNLAISDLMLGVLCMPFTLTGALLRNFIFGEIMCKLLPFLQACSVSVGVWTLVAISVERYYAICHPLRSLRWQTLGHAYRLIAAIWLGSFICMAPIAALSQLQPTRQGKKKCRENWSSLDYERAYNLFLDAILLVIPLLVLAVTYSMITKKLCKGMKIERQGESNAINLYVNQQGRASMRRSTIRSFTCDHYRHSSRLKLHHNGSSDSNSPPPSSKRATPLLRRSNAERSLNNKKRVVKMLFAVVLEFFVCWTPLYVINTLALFDPQIVYSTVGYSGVGFFQLLAYTSSCCNPITYCFMNSSFKKAFLNSFKCFKKFGGTGNYALTSSGMNMESKSSNNRASE